jgi:hypothetical protein
MGGKAILILVLGFSLIFMVAQTNYSTMATQTTQNLTSYYNLTKCRNAALSGINLLSNRLFFRGNAVDTVFTFTFDGVSVLDSMVTIDADLNIKRIVSRATISLPHSIMAPQDEWYFSSLTKVILKPSLFSKYAYFSNNEGSNIYWSGKDTVWGPMHTNGDLRFNGNSRFYGPVSIGGTEYRNGNTPYYLGGFSKNVQIAIPTNGVTNVQTNYTGGVRFTGQSLIYLEFRGDSIRYKTSATGAYTYRLLSTWAPNGVISCENAEVHVKGDVKGKYSVAVSGTTGNQGNIYLEDDITYHTNPLTTPTTIDMLGLIAKRNVIVVDNVPNKTDIKIQAALYCETGSFTVQNYDVANSSPYAANRGTIQLLGGITQSVRGAVGTGSGNTISTGYAKSYKYDERLLVSYPPYYPGCGSYEVVSWFE